MNIAILMGMSIEANIADLKDNLSEYLARVEGGEEVIVCKRNKPVARITPVNQQKNRSKPGWGKGTVKILGPVTGPVIDGWDVLE